MRGETRTGIAADLDVATVAAPVVAGAALGLYAAWIAADLLARWVVFLVVTVGGGYALHAYAGTNGRETAAYACYALAGLVAVTPIFVVLPDVLSADAYGVDGWALAFTIANLFLAALFAVPAAVLAYVGYRLNGGRGIAERARDRRSP